MPDLKRSRAVYDVRENRTGRVIVHDWYMGTICAVALTKSDEYNLL
jgi:hypothetical protein